MLMDGYGLERQRGYVIIHLIMIISAQLMKRLILQEI